MLRLALVALAALVPTCAASAADGGCGEWKGRTVSPVGFDAAAAAYAPGRGARPDAPLLVAKALEDPAKYLAWDEATRSLTVRGYAFRNSLFRAQSAFTAAGVLRKLPAHVVGNIDVVVARDGRRPLDGVTAIPDGRGGRTTAKRVLEDVRVIFDEAGPPHDGALFQTADRVEAVLDRVPMSREAADALRPDLHAALVIEPKAPWRVKDVHVPRPATFYDPVEVHEAFDVLVADVRCALLLDGAGTVLGAYPTR